jgi:hypothetical protein
MIVAERLSLQTGSGAWLEFSRLALVFLATAALVSTPTAWAWRLAALVLLAVTYRLSRKRMRRNRFDLHLTLFSDGTAVATGQGCAERTLTWPARGVWASRRLCILPVREDARADIIYCVILASRNNPDDYRRLLSWLRLGVGANTEVLPA